MSFPLEYFRKEIVESFNTKEEKIDLVIALYDANISYLTKHLYPSIRLFIYNKGYDLLLYSFI